MPVASRIMESGPTISGTPTGVAPDASHRRSAVLSDPDQWVEQHGDYLFKYAMVWLRDETKAEDMVQETFLAAFKGGEKFEGRSAEKSWLVGILKNKICDYYRKAGRETSFTDLEFYQHEDGDRLIQEGTFRDAWVHSLGPSEWSPRPGEGSDNELFRKTCHACSNKLPRNISAAFLMRELDGVPSKEICGILKISESNLWVMLHRARMALRRC